MEERSTMEAASGTMPELAQALAERYELLSPSQRRAIDVLLTDTRVASFVSARELAQQAGVSTSIVTRAAQTLGFAGYPELQTRLREQLLNAMPRRIESTIADLGETPETAAVRIMEEDIEGIRQVLESCSLETLREGVDLLVSARRIYIFGARGSFGLAHILCTGLRLAHPEIHLLSQAAGDLADQLVLLREGDALVVIGFRRLDHFTGGTHAGNPFCVGMAHRVLDLLEAHPEYYTYMDTLGKRLAGGIRDIFRRRELPYAVVQHESIVDFKFRPGPPNRNYDDALAADKARYAAYYHEMRKRNILLPPSQNEVMFVSTAHSDADIDETLVAIDESLEAIQG